MCVVAKAASNLNMMRRILLPLSSSSLSLLLNPRKPYHSQIPSFLHIPIAMSSWACKKCTFLNSPSQKSQCQICLSSPPSSPLRPSSSSSPPSPKWSCKACTFLNPYNNSACEVCATRCPVLSLSSLHDLNDTLLDADNDSSVGSVFFPLRPCSKRKAADDDDSAQPSTFRQVKKTLKTKVSDDDSAEPSSSSFRQVKTLKPKVSDDSIDVTRDENVGSGKDLGSLKIMSYNVWFREDLELHKRMEAIGDLVLLHSPDFICFQEVTSNIYDIFKKSSWWNAYRCSVSSEKAERPYFCMLLSKLPVKYFSSEPFSNSIMGRELCIAEVEAVGGKSLVVATSHLESPCPGPPKWDQMFSKERVQQANEAANFLKKYPNVIFGGDMNWNDKLDGPFPLPDGWIDAWSELRPKESGLTYDTKSNRMLSGNRNLQMRLDRFVCCLRDLKVSSIDMIGMDAIPGTSYIKEKKVRKETKQLVLPVLPSDHYGLLLTISSK